MTKLLINRLVVYLALLVIAISSTVKAETALEYYSNLFQSWGLEVDTLPSPQNNQPATKKDLQVLYDKITGGINTTEPENALNQSVVRDKHYLLLLDSQRGEWEELTIRDQSYSYKKVLLISKTYPQDFYPNESSSANKIFDTVSPKVIGDTIYYAIPEVFLTTPKLLEPLSNYFRAIATAENQSTGDVLNKEDSMKKNTVGSLNTIKDSPLTQGSFYALTVLFVFTVLLKGLGILTRNPKFFLQKQWYELHLKKAVGFVVIRSNYLAFVFFIIASFYVPILYCLILKADIIGDKTYPVRYITTTLNPLNIPNYLVSQNVFRLGFLSYNYLLAVLGGILLLPKLVQIFTLSNQKIASVKLTPLFVKWAFPFIVLISIVLLSVIDYKAVTAVLVVFIVTLLGFIWYMHSRRINYPLLFNKTEKYMLSGLVVAGLMLNFAWSSYEKVRPKTYTYEPLIVLADDVTVLPYSKKWGNNVLFEPQYYKGNSMIFAGDYLVYASTAQRLINKPLSSFKPEGNFIITVGSRDGLVEALLKNPSLLPYTESPQYSPLFTLPNVSLKPIYNQELTLSLTLDCAQKPESTNIKLRVISLNDLNSSKDVPLKTRADDILRFPGCDQNLLSETFQVPVDAKLIPEENAVLEIEGIDDKYILQSKLSLNGEPISTVYINNNIPTGPERAVIYKSNFKSITTEIFAYSAGVTKETIFYIDRLSSSFDISVPINSLMKQNLLKNPFIIWSDTPNEIIRDGE